MMNNQLGICAVCKKPIHGHDMILLESCLSWASGYINATRQARMEKHACLNQVMEGDYQCEVCNP